MSTKAYDPSKVSLLLGGLEPTDYAPDTKIVVSRENDVNSETVGVDGNIVVNIDPRLNGTVTISLMHNSAFNDVIYTWIAASKLTGNPLFPVYFKDPSGQKIDTIGWFKNQGDYTTAQETSTIDWVIGIENATLRPLDTDGILGAIEAFNAADDIL